MKTLQEIWNCLKEGGPGSGRRPSPYAADRLAGKHVAVGGRVLGRLRAGGWKHSNAWWNARDESRVAEGGPGSGRKVGFGAGISNARKAFRNSVAKHGSALARMRFQKTWRVRAAHADMKSIAKRYGEEFVMEGGPGSGHKGQSSHMPDGKGSHKVRPVMMSNSHYGSIQRSKHLGTAAATVQSLFAEAKRNLGEGGPGSGRRPGAEKMVNIGAGSLSVSSLKNIAAKLDLHSKMSGLHPSMVRSDRRNLSKIRKMIAQAGSKKI